MTCVNQKITLEERIQYQLLLRALTAAMTLTGTAGYHVGPVRQNCFEESVLLNRRTGFMVVQAVN
ncbi:hypothetical protein ABH15_09420 [Methanoculleus taiwanensis]|uniref:Uncharacterized protein n=1 Tax=Methanoculleus taiwanensis TaxID=1550565 RepID=A0A498H0J5_9EURY|nr:hypothetical protein ABH15_09420 [Methanoculleus taiwanensis]